MVHIHFWVCLFPVDVFLVFLKDPCKGNKSIHYFELILRPAVLELADKFESAGGWASEAIFSKWVSKQEWRRCLPSIFEFVVDRDTWLRSFYFSEVPKVEIPKLINSGFKAKAWHVICLTWRYQVWIEQVFPENRFFFFFSGLALGRSHFSAACMRQMHQSTPRWTRWNWECFFLMKWHLHSITSDLVTFSLASWLALLMWPIWTVLTFRNVCRCMVCFCKWVSI